MPSSSAFAVQSFRRALRTVPAAIALAAVVGSTASAQENAQLLIMVTSGNPQVQLMSMVLAMQSAQQGAAPRILLCGEAGDLALRDAPASATTGQPPRDMSPQGLMQSIMSQSGARVEVCAIYLPGKGVDGSALVDGVTAADPAEIGALLVDPDVKVVSF